MLLPSAGVLFSDKLVRIKWNGFNSTIVAQPMSTAWSKGHTEMERERQRERRWRKRGGRGASGTIEYLSIR